MIHRIFFFLLIIFLPTQLGLHFWPEWSYVLGRRIDFLSPTLFLTDIFLLLTCISWCMTWIKTQYPISNHQYPTWKKNKLYFVISIVFLIFTFVYFNIKNAASWQVSAFSWVKFFEYALLFFYIIKTKPSMQLLSGGLTIGIFYSSCIAIGQFALQHSIGGLLWFLGERTFSIDTPGIARFPLCLPTFFGCVDFLRSYATFPHPNVFAGYLAVGIPLLINYPIIQFSNYPMIQLIFNDTKRLLSGLRIAAIALGLVALLLTFSRSAVFVVIIFVLHRIITSFHFDKVKLLNTEYRILNVARPACSESFRRERSRREYRILNTAFMIHASIFKKMIMLFIFLLCVVGLYVLKSVGPLDESVVVRQELMNSAWTLFQSSLLFGIGLGNFIVRLPEVLTAHTVYFLQPVHNIYLLVLSEIGIVGVGLFSLLGIYFVNSEYRILNTEGNLIFKYLKRYKLFTLPYSLLRIELRTGTALFTILILGLVDHYWFTLQQGQMLFTIVLGYSLGNLRKIV